MPEHARGHRCQGGGSALKIKENTRWLKIILTIRSFDGFGSIVGHRPRSYGCIWMHMDAFSTPPTQPDIRKDAASQYTRSSGNSSTSYVRVVIFIREGIIFEVTCNVISCRNDR